MFFFFSDCTESECFLEMGMDMKRLWLQLGGGLASSLSVQLTVLTLPAHPSAGLIQNKRIKKEGNEKKSEIKKGKTTTFA